MKPNGRNKAERNDAPYQVTGNHNALAIEAIEQNACQRAREHCRYGSRQHQGGNDAAAMCLLNREAQDRNVVEVVANFADNLAQPRKSVVTVMTE